MRVYRVAHPGYRIDGWPAGPYTVNDTEMGRDDRITVRSAVDGHMSSNYHLSPREDPSLDGIADEEACGFTSRLDLYRWFEPEVCSVLVETGFSVLLYDVPAARVGVNGQCVFTVSDAVHVGGEALYVAD